MLNQGWNSIRMGSATNMRSVVPGVIDPSQVLLQRVAEDEQAITVAFKGLDQALDNPEQDGPTLKRYILAWVKNFTPEAQIERSNDTNVFTIRIMKAAPAQPQAQQMAENAMWRLALSTGLEQPRTDSSLVHITKRKIT